MPFYHFRCDICYTDINKILSAEDSRREHLCKICSSVLTRNPRGASSQTMEVLDSGMLVKPLTRYADAETLFRDRAEASSYPGDDEE